MKIAIVNGPNLNLVGNREKSIYGEVSLSDYLEKLASNSSNELLFFQSNIEGELIDFLQKTEVHGFVLNAGGYTHTSVALRDCVAGINTPVVEVHISNITSRESFRHNSLLSPVCAGCILGFGLSGYELAINYFEKRLK
jgi:3-dehydroquinate dehydratase-2